MKQPINEIKRMQLLAGVITESEYHKSLVKENKSQQLSDLEKKAFEFFNSPKVSKLIDQSLVKLSPEDKKELQSTVSNISEAVGSGFSSFLDIVHKAEEKVLEEAENEKNDLKTKVGKVLSGFGSANIMSMGTLPALVSLAIDHFANTNILNAASQAVGDGSIAGGLSIIAGLIGGGILWAIGKKMQGVKDLDNEPIAESAKNNPIPTNELITLLNKAIKKAKNNIKNADNFDLEDLSQVLESYVDDLKEIGDFEKFDDEDE